MYSTLSIFKWNLHRSKSKKKEKKIWKFFFHILDLKNELDIAYLLAEPPLMQKQKKKKQFFFFLLYLREWTRQSLSEISMDAEIKEKKSKTIFFSYTWP